MPHLAKSTILRPDDSSASALLWSRIVELLAASGRSLRGQLAAHVSNRGISEPQFFVLLACGHAPPEGVGQNDLASRLARSAAHTSGLVEQLRADGLIVGRRSDTDRRRQLWSLTAAGQTVLNEMLSELKGWASQQDAKMETARRDALVALLETLAGQTEQGIAIKANEGHRPALRIRSTEGNQA